jgi:gliding motility-associated-like protein
MYTVKAVQRECPLTILSKSVIVLFQKDCNPEIPNIFTPNNDGINDLFVIKDLEKFPNGKIEIFNRWGLKVYQNTNYSNDWNGTDYNTSKPLTPGVYFYILHRSDNILSKGFVSIER